MQSALLANADRIIIAHNHTDGDLTVRAMDDYVTKQVKKACQMFGIELLDHIIITRDSYYSFADNKRL
jgi:DNA repair protein RadC